MEKITKAYSLLINWKTNKQRNWTSLNRPTNKGLS